MFKVAVPVLHVSSSEAAERFYCDGLGFRREFTYRPEATSVDPGYLGLRRDGVALHVSSFPGDGIAGAVVNLVVDDIDGLHQELVAKLVPIALAPTDQTWGEREMYVRDADDNCIRFIQEPPKKAS